jgi:predicted CXXCH cytochrome family protein
MRFLLKVIVIGLMSIPAVAQQHPALDANASAAVCISCHQDKAKGRFVHATTDKGCLSCHEVRVIKDLTRIKLITPSPLKLCLQCHRDKDATQMKGQVHAPAVRDCLECHDPHTSATKNELRKPISGSSKAENLCLDCHQTGMDVAKGGSRHEALDLGCDTCHTTHKGGDRSSPQFAFHLTKSSPALCLDCHDAADAALIRAHQGQPFGKSDCVSCHDPHQSARPKLMQAFLHPPFGEKLCDVCHEPAKDGRVVLAEKNVKALCAGCHSDQVARIESAKFQHQGAQGDCTDCHDPHAGKSRAYPKQDPINVCLNCHTDQAELQNKRVLHQPVFGQGCTTCHDPHGGERAKLLRADGNALCTECHGTGVTHKVDQGTHAVAIFDGRVQLPENYFAQQQVVHLDLKDGIGHPVWRHPVSDVHDPANPTRIKTPLGCLSCHQPHAGGARAMLVKDLPPSLQFCRTCHQENFGTD